MKRRIETPFGLSQIYRPATDAGEPVLVVPGYSESLTHTKQLVNALAGLGYDAMTFATPRRRAKSVAPDLVERQGKIVLSILDSLETDNQKMHVVAHSLGCAAVLYAACQEPERFASLMLMQPLGMVGEQAFSEMLGRVSKKVAANSFGALRERHWTYKSEAADAEQLDRETKMRYSARIAKAQIAAAGIIGKNPSLAIQEAKAAGHYSITDDVKEVVRHGVPVHLVTADGDEMFDMHKTAEGYELIAEHLTSYTRLSDAAAVHDTFWMHPERSAYLVSHALHPDQ